MGPAHIAPVLLLSAAATSVFAQGLPDASAASLPSCVSDARLELRTADERAWLDTLDRESVGRAMLQRYPVLGRDGFEPAAILMWRQPGRDWLYVTLTRRDGEPAGWCFSATFSAGVFDITPALVFKYFGPGPAKT